MYRVVLSISDEADGGCALSIQIQKEVDGTYQEITPEEADQNLENSSALFLGDKLLESLQEKLEELKMAPAIPEGGAIV